MSATANAAVVPVAYGFYNNTFSVTTTSQVIFSLNVQPLQVLAIKAYFLDLVITNSSGSSAVNVGLQIYASGFGFPSPQTITIGPSGTTYNVSIAPSGTFYGPITWVLRQGDRGSDLTRGGVVGLAAIASAATASLTFSYEIIEAYFGGVI